MGPAFNRPMVARGAAYADYDHDGDLDVLVTTNNGPAYLFRNDGGNRNHWLNVRLRRRANPTATASARWCGSKAPPGKQWNMVRSGSSYCSQSDLALTFGVGQDTKVTQLQVEWPSGAKQQLTDISVNQFLKIEEPK